MVKRNEKRSKVNKKNRKEDRKEKRKLKKVLRDKYYTNKYKNNGNFVKHPDQVKQNEEKNPNKPHKPSRKKVNNKVFKQKADNNVFMNDVIRDQQKEKRHQKCLENEMFKKRRKQLQEANEKEDESIRKLEKQLNLKTKNKRAIPKSFADDGLDYLLELCESDTLAQAAKTEKQLANIKDLDEFDKDVEIALGNIDPSFLTQNDVESDEADCSTSSIGDTDSEICEFKASKDSTSVEPCSANSDKDIFDTDDSLSENGLDDLSLRLENCISDDDVENSNSSFDEEMAYNCLSLGDFPDGIFRPENLSPIPEETGNDLETYNKNSHKILKENSVQKKKNLKKEDIIGNETNKHELSDESPPITYDSKNQNVSSKDKSEKDEIWEDIYGRKRDNKGNVIKEQSGKYIPPQARARQATAEQSEKILRIKRHIKGLLNKLTELNMHSIAADIEGIYMSNSRHDTNDILTNLSLEFLIDSRSIPDTMIAHHAMLISVLQANVGTEVGAYYLQIVAKHFDNILSQQLPVDNKKLDNVVGVLSHLYNFKIYLSPLLLEILTKLSENLNEKTLDCILVVLRTSGFFLRKEDPSALKDIIIKLQAIANTAPLQIKNNFRVKFMLDVLLAIKNNNISKIPSYDHTQSEHLRKIVKNHYRKGNYISTLNITLDDLLNADEQGRWWLVGSAWSGNKANENKDSAQGVLSTSIYSQKLLKLAKEQRMNTDIRKNIFCAIMSAEDYLDAFEKISRLGLKGSQEREVAHVLLSCCLQEKVYNPYYSVLAQKFCETDRKYQMSLQYSVWDKLRDLSSLTSIQSRNLAKFLVYLFVERGLPISVLKIIEFSELQKLELRLIRQVLLGILLNPNEQVSKQVFERVSIGPKLRLFRQGLRLFLQHFLLADANTSSKICNKEKDLLKQRIKIVDQVLSIGELNTHF